jgi:hypothetical protein
MSSCGPADFSKATEYGDTGTNSAWWSDVRLEPHWNSTELRKLQERFEKWFQWRTELLREFTYALERIEIHFQVEVARGLKQVPDQGTAEMFREYRGAIRNLEAEMRDPIGGLVVTVNRTCHSPT